MQKAEWNKLHYSQSHTKYYGHVILLTVWAIKEQALRNSLERNLICKAWDIRSPQIAQIVTLMKWLKIAVGTSKKEGVYMANIPASSQLMPHALCKRNIKLFCRQRKNELNDSDFVLH